MAFTVAIDGPSGAGKSTVAFAIAERFGFVMLNTGLMYRTIGLIASERFHDTAYFMRCEDISPMLSQVNMTVRFDEDGVQHMLLDGTDYTGELSAPEISMWASAVSGRPEVREYLLSYQRAFAEQNNVVMDGRDIGTVVVPNAQAKLFLTASSKARAERRYIELRDSGADISLKEVLAQMEQRDRQDSGRKCAPLRKADDAFEIDSTNLSLEAVIEIAASFVGEKWKTYVSER